MKTRAPSPGQHETLDELIAGAGRRNGVPVRRTFLQQGPQNRPAPGPLSAMLRAHDEHALDAFLIHRLLASSDPWDVTRYSAVWGRALGLNDRPGGEAASATAASKVFARLDTKYKLLTRTRRGRMSKLTSLREDGSGLPYTYPGGRSDPYFKVPEAYWTAGAHWYAVLPFAAKAMLLILLTLRPGALLPYEKTAPWYGISADTSERGLKVLRHHKIVTAQRTVRTDWLSPTGKTSETRYFLQEPFARVDLAIPAPRRHLKAV